MDSLKSLTKKYGPLPAWAWALLVSLILFLLYRHFKGKSSATAAVDTSALTDSGSVASVPSSDVASGGPVDTSGNSFIPDSLPNTAVDQSTITPWWEDPANWRSDVIAPLQSEIPTAPAAVKATPVTPVVSAKPTQIVGSKSLNWGGQTFTTKAAFDKWAKTHGSSPAKEFAQHPQAASIYATLK